MRPLVFSVLTFFMVVAFGVLGLTHDGVRLYAQGASIQPLRLVSERTFPPGGTVELVLHSRSLGRDYTVVVTPPSGDFALQGRKLPAIYVLDGGYGFAGALAQFMGGSGQMSLAYVVSVGVVDAARISDFIDTPMERDGTVVGGGGAAFREFLLNELRPYLEARFPIDSSRVALVGHSLAGTFTAGILSRSPNSFSAYVIASPALWPAPNLTDALSKTATQGGRTRVYITVGGQERPELLQDFERVTAALGASGSTFDVEQHTFPGENHISYLPLLFSAAFKWAMPPAPRQTPTRTPIAVSTEALDRLVGVYGLDDGRNISITRSGTQIFSQVSTSALKAPLLAETSSKFFVSGFDYTITFEGADDPQASGLVFRFNGAEVKAKRSAP